MIRTISRSSNTVTDAIDLQVLRGAEAAYAIIEHEAIAYRAGAYTTADFAFGLLVAALVATGCGDAAPRLTPQEALTIALPHINRAFVESSPHASDYETWFEDGVWTVSPRLPEGSVGGGPSAEISDATGALIRTMFTE